MKDSLLKVLASTTGAIAAAIAIATFMVQNTQVPEYVLWVIAILVGVGIGLFQNRLNKSIREKEKNDD